MSGVAALMKSLTVAAVARACCQGCVSSLQTHSSEAATGYLCWFGWAAPALQGATNGKKGSGKLEVKCWDAFGEFAPSRRLIAAIVVPWEAFMEVTYGAVGAILDIIFSAWGAICGVLGASFERRAVLNHQMATGWPQKVALERFLGADTNSRGSKWTHKWSQSG